jgi:hypothetical protein
VLKAGSGKAEVLDGAGQPLQFPQKGYSHF